MYYLQWLDGFGNIRNFFDLQLAAERAGVDTPAISTNSSYAQAATSCQPNISFMSTIRNMGVVIPVLIQKRDLCNCGELFLYPFPPNLKLESTARLQAMLQVFDVSAMIIRCHIYLVKSIYC